MKDVLADCQIDNISKMLTTPRETVLWRLCTLQEKRNRAEHERRRACSPWMEKRNKENENQQKTRNEEKIEMNERILNLNIYGNARFEFVVNSVL